MNFSQIRCFLAAAEYLSFTRAADSLYLSQPVLSRQIAAMEEELGIELFVREKKSVRLTQAGQIMEEGLRRLSLEYESILEKAMAAHLGFAGNLNIGIVEGQNIRPPLSDALRTFHEKYPDIRINPSRHTMRNLRSALINGQIDAGYTAKFVGRRKRPWSTKRWAPSAPCSASRRTTRSPGRRTCGWRISSTTASSPCRRRSPATWRGFPR